MIRNNNIFVSINDGKKTFIAIFEDTTEQIHFGSSEKFFEIFAAYCILYTLFITFIKSGK